IKFPLGLFYETFFRTRSEKLLILEYGIESKSDAMRLLSIACPDWLLLSGVQLPDSGLGYEGIIEGLSELIKEVGSSSTIWLSDDPQLEPISALLDRSLGISLENLRPTTTPSVGQSYL